jgi:elongation factor P hydroxylase
MKSSTSCVKAISAEAVTAVFNRCFLQSFNTRLQGAAPEPLYLPASAENPACIFYRQDYVASALHEVAHWCIAGPVRRQQADYGYWYAADGRSASEQRRFMQVEARPQALEWCFSQALAQEFRLSLDNLDAPPTTQEQSEFVSAVLAAARTLRSDGLPPRAQQFFDALVDLSGTGMRVSELDCSAGALT